MFGLDTSSPLTLICGFGVLCCALPMLFFLMIARLTGGRITLLPMALSLLPMIGTEVLGWIMNRGDDQAETPMAQAYDRLAQRSQSFRSRVQSTGGGFDSQGAAGYGVQNTPQTRNDPLAPRNDSFPPPQRPNLRGGRRGPSRFGRQQAGDWGDLPMGDNESVRVPDDEDLLGPASLPGLRGRFPDTYNPPNRPHRDKRQKRNESWDDEVFGGMLDDDGDGYADF